RRLSHCRPRRSNPLSRTRFVIPDVPYLRRGDIVVVDAIMNQSGEHMLRPWAVKSRVTVFSHPRLEVAIETVQLPDGRVVEDYIQVEIADHSVVVPWDEKGRWLVQRQYKHGPRKVGLTFPAGRLNEHETPLDAAKRELYEETGLVCDVWHSLGSF